MLMPVGCADDAGIIEGSGGEPGTGGMGAVPDAGVSCVVSGCQDGNECTIDGMCEPISGACVGADIVPADTPCGPDGIFACDREGHCGCNRDEQCADFFPDNECFEDPKCIRAGCPPPDPLPDGTPCSGGECRSGVCSSPWAPKRQFVPMACGSSISAGLFDSRMDLTVAPTPIPSAGEFNATLDALIEIPQRLLQDAVIAAFPTPLDDIEVSDARAKIESTGVVSGRPVNTILAPLPQTVSIPQTPNPGDPGNQDCEIDDDCLLGRFGQVCSLAGRCECACEPGCAPRNCANVVEGDVVLRLERIHGAIYDAFRSGEVCFDAGGDAFNADIALPIGTGIRVTSNPMPLAIECQGGGVNDNGTPDVPEDDVVVANPPEDQICFPIGSPEQASN